MTAQKNKRVLILNRGEIAIRGALAISELGHFPIGVTTEMEPAGLHLKYCSDWVHLNGSTNAETFLNIPQVIEICKKHKIDAVFPGYGFLSENADFVKALDDNNVIFVGPHQQAIASMGDKAVSKKIAQEAGVPVVPGSVGEVESIEEALKWGDEIGYPVLLKAVAGGGGKGMRTCFNPDELKDAFGRVKSEALKSFANDGLLVEKFIVNPHHIEVQIITNHKGEVFHCYERECSIQRRHQKVVEEATSPFIGDDHELRKKVCETAVRLAEKVKYNSAGTVEFIMGEDKQFYFLEMNTRIQVEHPITEEITGVDLVRSMVQTAFGEDLDFKHQSDIQIQGHAIECRICAEDPVTLLPAPGTIDYFGFQNVQGMRFDHCIYSGLEVRSDFDPMLAKLVIRAKNRKACIQKMKRALEQLRILGIPTNIPLHQAIFEESDFVAGNYDTGYLSKHEIKLPESTGIVEWQSALSNIDLG